MTDPNFLGSLADALEYAAEREREKREPYTGDGIVDITQHDMNMLTCPVLNRVGQCLSGCREEPICYTEGPWTPRDAAGLYLGNEITRDQLKSIAAERWRTSHQEERFPVAESRTHHA